MARPRVDRKRYPGGRPVDIPKAEREAEIMGPALAARARHMGAKEVSWREDDRTLVRIAANDPLWGYHLGKMYADQQITRPQLDALERFGMLRRSVLPLMTEGRINPGSSGDVMTAGGRSVADERPEDDLRTRRSYSDAHAALRDLMRVETGNMLSLMDLLDRLLVLDRGVAYTALNLGVIRSAANVLARHFKL